MTARKRESVSPRIQERKVRTQKILGIWNRGVPVVMFHLARGPFYVIEEKRQTLLEAACLYSNLGLWCVDASPKLLADWEGGT